MPRTRAASSRRSARPERARCALALCVLVACVTRAAQAEVVVRVAGAGSAELGRKLDSELRYAGFGVQRVSAGAEAPALVVESAERVELVLSRPGDAERVTQTLTRGEQDGDAFALRVVEHLRARLVDLGWSLDEAEPAAVEPAAVEPVPPVAPPPAPRDEPALEPARASVRRPLMLWLDVGAQGSAAAGGLGLTPHGVLAARLELPERLGVSLTGYFPLAFNEAEAEEGEAELAWHLFVAGVDYSLPLPEPWLASAGLRAGVLVIDVQGSGGDDYVGRGDRLLAGAYGVELGAGVELTDWLRLRATLLTGFTAPRPVLRFDEREVASLGRWLGSAGITLEIGLPLSSGEAR